MWPFTQEKKEDVEHLKRGAEAYQEVLTMWDWIIDPFTVTESTKKLFEDIKNSLPTISENMKELKTRKQTALATLSNATSQEEIIIAIEELKNVLNIEARYLRMIKYKFQFICKEVRGNYDLFEKMKLGLKVSYEQLEEKKKTGTTQDLFMWQRNRLKEWVESYESMLTVMIYLTKDILYTLIEKTEKRVRSEFDCLHTSKDKQIIKNFKKFIFLMTKQEEEFKKIQQEMNFDTLKNNVDEVIKKTLILENAKLLAKGSANILTTLLLGLIPNVLSSVLEVLKTSATIQLATTNTASIKKMEFLVAK